MFNSTQLRELVIKPTLIDLLMYSKEAEELLVFTCANESLGGTYLHQVNGPALGIYQMEPGTYNDIWANFILFKRDILLQLQHSFDIGRMPSEDRLVYDIRFATAMARIHYMRVKSPLPSANDINGIWNYYKTYYNTIGGKANYIDAIKNYEKFTYLLQ